MKETIARRLHREAGGETALRQGMILTVGTVVDTNDPQQMGRVRAVCPFFGDTFDMLITDVPWALCVTPFAGANQVGTRGPGLDSTDGYMAYGLWAIPKIGAQVIIGFLDGNVQQRIWLGCLHDQLTPHTMPHGRFMFDDHPTLEEDNDFFQDGEVRPFGPYSTEEKFIKPTKDNLKTAFTSDDSTRDGKKYEWRTRGADYSVSAVDLEDLVATWSQHADDKDYVYEEWMNRQGYQLSRIRPDLQSPLTQHNFDNQVTALVSPGFHALSMDDRQENCRIRLRTTSGHQVILDDTNERIYIQTAGGENWIEMDQKGNIDVFTSNKVNIHAAKDINFTADETIRMYAGKGIHMYSGDEVRLQAAKDVHFKFAQNWHTHVSQDVYIQTDQDLNVKSGQASYWQSVDNIEVKSGADLNLTSGGTTNQNAGAAIIETAPAIHHNGPGATTAAPATSPSELAAYWTSRVPDHEPWGRVMTKDDTTHDPEVSYTDASNGKVERGVAIPRGTYWRR